MKSLRILFLTLVFPMIMVACTGTSNSTPVAGEENPSTQAGASAGSWGEGTLLVDDQGSVTVEVTPLNPANPGETLDFQIVLDTHSVDLSMNLAELASLTTDTGKTVQAVKWEAPLGGHHVEGTLSFPVEVNNTPLLEEAATLTLTIVNLDAPTRTFVWGR
ncbi:MAG: hypothetical protein Fur0022_02060 [Anaerolineales bacterium]